MDISKISKGKNYPNSFNVVIEIQANVPPVKYEIEKESGAVFVDRFVATPMFYPAHYGFIPNTTAGDGDPIDVLVLCDMPLVPGCVIESRPIGMLTMEDDGGVDYKVIAVPSSSVTKQYDNIKSINDLPELKLSQIQHFFERYKDLEKGKWTKVQGFEEDATSFLNEYGK